MKSFLSFCKSHCAQRYGQNHTYFLGQKIELKMLKILSVSPTLIFVILFEEIVFDDSDMIF